MSSVFIKCRKHISFVNVGVVVVLLFAMSGGAYAASKILITSTKQISPKVLKALRSHGPEGPAGPQGPAGVAGATGIAGVQGEKGSPGSNGVSVTSKESKTKLGPCKEGGSEFKAVSGVTYACNGEKGEMGPQGPTGTFGGEPLPKGKSLTGVWAASSYAGNSPLVNFEEAGWVEAGVSFAEPVSPVIQASQAQYIGVGEGENEPEEKWAPAIKEGFCKGDAEKPVAAEGYLCVFAEEENNLFSHPTFSLPVVSETSVGFDIHIYLANKGRGSMHGIWVVTAA